MSQKRKAVVNVVVAGVGGQGSILASHLLAQSALKEGLDVKLAETFGAATRGGSVMAHVRMGEVWAPTMMEDEADVVVSMEPLEGLRVATQFLKPGGWALINTRPWMPVDVASGPAESKLVCIPKMRPFIYQVVQLKNPAAYPLLAGRIHTYRAGSYVGDTHLRYKAPGEPMALSLGIAEERLQVRWVSAAEDTRFATTIRDVVETVAGLGPNPIGRDDANRIR